MICDCNVTWNNSDMWWTQKMWCEIKHIVKYDRKHVKYDRKNVKFDRENVWCDLQHKCDRVCVMKKCDWFWKNVKGCFCIKVFLLVKHEIVRPTYKNLLVIIIIKCKSWAIILGLRFIFFRLTCDITIEVTLLASNLNSYITC